MLSNIKSLKSKKKKLAGFFPVEKYAWATQKILFRPIKIINFLTPARIQKCLT